MTLEESSLPTLSEKIDRNALLEAGYEEFFSKSLDYEGGKLLTFGVMPKVDLYYQTDMNYCQLVTGRTTGRGNRTLFDGRIDTMDELKFIINACTYYYD